MEKEGKLKTSVLRKGNIIEINIGDTGKGIKPGVLPKIFDEFVTTKERGTGLGLTIAKRFVEAHGGTIEVKSTYGKGTTVAVCLQIEHENGGEN
ncbi:hypothetical protein BEH94_10460 [Candidatus Altiarchaeales archaeon WOR_SM1_SCG]|nr:hypothetical protein BEH94_10460 [Candidatus Altiarchaeales archaeon WOR_SM1_SCG]